MAHVSLALADQRAARNQADTGIRQRLDQQANSVEPEAPGGVGKYQDVGPRAAGEIVQHGRFPAAFRHVRQDDARVIRFPNDLGRAVHRSIRSDPHFDSIRWIIEGVEIGDFFENSLSSLKALTSMATEGKSSVAV